MNIENWQCVVTKILSFELKRIVSDVAVFVLTRDVELQPTNRTKKKLQ